MITEDSTASLELTDVTTQPRSLNTPPQSDSTESSEGADRTNQLSNSKPMGLTFLMIVMAVWSNAIPWLYEGYAWCAWIGMALAMQLAIGSDFGSKFFVTWIWSSILLGITFHWSPAAMQYTLSSSYALGFAVALPLIVWDGLRLALGFWIAAKFTQDVRYYWLYAALTSIALEYTMPGVFPWKLGLTQLSMPWLIQGVEVFGASFSTFVAFAIAGAVQVVALSSIRWLRKSPKSSSITRLVASPAIVTLACVAMFNAISWQRWGLAMHDAKKIRVGLVQVDPSFVESSGNLRQQTIKIADQVELICWPESSAGNYDLQLNSLANDEQNFAMSRDPERGMRPWPHPSCELLVGGKNYVGNAEEPDELYVTAMLIDRNESITARHNKRFLMPFGEYVPCDKYIPGLAELFDMAECVQPGKWVAPIETSCGASIGTMLCYEDMVPQAAREMVLNDANLLASLANGSAFESKFTLYQHRMIAHLRAIECRRYFLRCAATGETCVINPLGEIESRLPMQIDGALVTQVGLMDGKTAYVQFPWTFPVLCCGILVFSIMAFNLHATRRRKELERRGVLSPISRLTTGRLG